MLNDGRSCPVKVRVEPEVKAVRVWIWKCNREEKRGIASTDGPHVGQLPLFDRLPRPFRSAPLPRPHPDPYLPLFNHRQALVFLTSPQL